jgi:hypothetical protein
MIVDGVQPVILTKIHKFLYTLLGFGLNLTQKKILAENNVPFSQNQHFPKIKNKFQNFFRWFSDKRKRNFSR